MLDSIKLLQFYGVNQKLRANKTPLERGLEYNRSRSYIANVRNCVTRKS